MVAAQGSAARRHILVGSVEHDVGEGIIETRVKRNIRLSAGAMIQSAGLS
jgi:hypothetical protein